jgi:hypothetical protein
MEGGRHADNEECTCRSTGRFVRHVTIGTRSHARALPRIADREPVQSDQTQGAAAPAQRLSRTLNGVLATGLRFLFRQSRQSHRLSRE